MTPAAARHILIDGSSARPSPFRGPFQELARWGALGFLRLSGWTLQGDWPEASKLVLVAAPHTSNWDGLYMLAAAAYYRVDLSWMGKKSLTQGPFGGLMKALGCIPIDRSKSNDLVAAMRDQFAARERLVLAIPPEGTRARVSEWKSGFYHIAYAAGAPILVTVLDYGTKTIRLAALVHPGGDYDADLALIRSHYASARGKHRDQFAG